MSILETITGRECKADFNYLQHLLHTKLKRTLKEKKEDEQQEEEHMGRERGWPGTERSEVQETGVAIEKHSLYFSVSKAD